MPKHPPGMAQRTAASHAPREAEANLRARLDEAERLLLQGQDSRALAICEQLVSRDPAYTGALNLLASLHLAKGDSPRALSFLVRSQMLNPHDGATLKLLAATYGKLGSWEMAARVLREALALSPDDMGALLAYSDIMRREQEYEIAAGGYRKVLASGSLLQAAETGLAMCHAAVGQFDEAARGFKNLLDSGTRSMPLLVNALQVHSRLPNLDWLGLAAGIKRGAAENKNDFDTAMAFLKAGIFDRSGRHAEAWQELVPANARQFSVMREAWRRQAADLEASMARVRDSIAQVAETRPEDGNPPVSLLILGPPRSGKTTLERVLASLGQVKRGYENPIIENAVRRAYQSAGFPASRQYWGMPAQVEALCRKFYLDELRRRAGAAKVFTNSDPDRILEAARIAAVIPNVRFAFVKRNPEDLALRIFMKNFAGGNAYAYDLSAIRQYIAWYQQFIDILAAKYPGISCVVHYEEMIGNPVETCRNIARLCGLDAEDVPFSAIEDDRNCAAPYRALMSQMETAGPQ